MCVEESVEELLARIYLLPTVVSNQLQLVESPSIVTSVSDSGSTRAPGVLDFWLRQIVLVLFIEGQLHRNFASAKLVFNVQHAPSDQRECDW